MSGKIGYVICQNKKKSLIKEKNNKLSGKNKSCQEKKSCCQENVDRKMLFDKKMISGKR